MNANERIYVKSYDCRSTEDDFKNGEALAADSSWTSKDTNFENAPDGYASIADALKAVCEHEYFDFVKENWLAFGAECEGEDPGRFDGDVMVDEANSQATESQLEKWRLGERKLWNCHIHVYLEVRSASRRLTPEEANSF